MKFNTTTGEFSFRPTASQAGDVELTFSAKTTDEFVTETLTLSVPALNPLDPTTFTGRVVDANSFTQGQLIPISGATVTFLTCGVTTTTDADGFFSLSSLPATAAIFDIDASTAQPAPDGAGYGSFREGLTLIQNVFNQEERPFFLPRIANESLTQVDPAQTTVVNNPTLGMTMTVPPNTAFNEDGTPFTGQLSISEVPLALAPVALPEFMQPGLLVTVQPTGVTFSTPVPITYPNVDNLPPGAVVDIWAVDRDLGEFVIIGTGQVTPGANFIQTISGGLTSTTWNCAHPSRVFDDPDGSKTQDENNNCPQCASRKGGSTFSLHDGHMSTRFSLPAYRSLEASRALTFNYRTFRAFPRPAIEVNTRLSGGNVTPPGLSYTLEVGGIDQGQEVFLSTDNLNAISRIRSTVVFDASDFASGIYDYKVTVNSVFAASKIGRIIEGKIMVVNEVENSFGSGWMLEGLYKLAFNQDQSVSIIAPNGRSINYRITANPDVFLAPDNDYATFIRNPDSSFTHTEKDGVKMHFNAAGQLLEHEDRNNNITAYAYDVGGKLASISDPVGLDTVFVYDTNNMLASITDPASRTTTFVYDVLGNMSKVTFPDATFETFEYDTRHLMTAHEDERGNRFLDRYDGFGRIIEGELPDGTIRAAQGKTAKGLVDVSSGIGTVDNPAPATLQADVDGDYVDGRGNASRRELDPHGRSTLEVDEIGRITTHARDADSNPTQTVRPIGSVVTRTFDNFGNVLTQKEEFNTATTTYTYDQFSLVSSVTNPRNNTTTINRDGVNGNPLSIVNALGHTTTMVYDSRGLITQMTSPNGLVTDYTYNLEGLMDTKTETPPVSSPGNVRLWSYSYFPTGLLQTVVTPDLITLNYSYDERSYLTSVTDNLNQRISYSYDAYKNVIKTETSSADSSLALLVDSIYDNRNRLIETRAPHIGIEESITQRLLDANSNLIGLIDPNGNASSNSYDAFNRLDSNTHREGGITQYTYDDQDRIIEVTAPNGVITDYEYDIISRRTQEISPDRGTMSYDYDLANNVISITDGRAITATMSYDSLERVASKTYPNTLTGKIEDVTYTYDTCAFGLGFLCARADESGSYSYNYDAFGNMITGSFIEIEGTLYSMAYTYDDGDNIIQSTYPSGRIIDYTRDGVRRIEAIDTTVNGIAQNIISNIQYRGDNQMLSCDFGNGLNDTRTYDLQGRLINQQLTDLTNFIVDDRTYTHDKNSNILNIATNFEQNQYSVDKLDRITSDTIDSDIPINFAYDLNDNRLAKQLQDLTTDELIEQFPNSNRIKVQDTLQIGTTPLQAGPDRDLVYNDVGRLYQLIEAGNLRAEYIYNDEGQRTRKTTYQADGITIDSITIYHYDQMGYLITETTETGALIKDYIWQEGMHPVAQIDNTQGTENVLYLHTDHLMTNRLATDQNQNIVWRWEGEAFGNTPADEIGGFSINLRFPGQYFDSESNLHYNRNRYYDPQLGRYITSDPIGLNGGKNTYSYVTQNPIVNKDPLGLAKFGWRNCNKGEKNTCVKYCNEVIGRPFQSCRARIGFRQNIDTIDYYALPNGLSCSCEDEPDPLPDEEEEKEGQGLSCPNNECEWVLEPVKNVLTGIVIFVMTCMIIAGP